MRVRVSCVLLCVSAQSKTTTTDKTRYRSVLGELQYLASSDRPDVCYTVGMLSRCQEWPTEACMKDAEQCAIYLYHTKDLGITYGKCPDDATLSWLFGMCDADWSVANSTSGWCFGMLHAVVLTVQASDRACNGLATDMPDVGNTPCRPHEHARQRRDVWRRAGSAGDDACWLTFERCCRGLHT